RSISLTSFAASATTQVGWLRNADVCLTYLTPATVGLAAMVLKRVWGVPYALYVQDLWPETVMASNFIANQRANELVEKALGLYLRRLYAGAAGIAAISPTMARTLANRGAGAAPVSIPNWVDETTFRPLQPTAPDYLDDRTWIMYAGGIGEVQSLDTAVDALALLRDRDDICLALVGEGVAVPGLRHQVEACGLGERVRFLGSRPMEQMPRLMRESAAQLVSLRDLPLFRGTIPSKLQASMATGCPVICAVAGDAAEIVREAEIGFVAIPEDAESLAKAFRELADCSVEERQRLGQRARDIYVRQMGAGSGAAALERLLKAAVERRAR
ncbi:MAG: glycosyltransferase family 4 protein, partial [Nocardioides sp.]|nr:glycosyltransferase family 4 protein [Nocardioides sp.]